MGSLARIWLALAGLVAGVLSGSGGPWAAAALGAGTAWALRRRSRWRGAAVALVCFGLGSLNASVRSVERLPAAALAEKVPACRISGRTLEEPGGLGTLAALDRAECDGHGVVTDAGAVFLDDVEVRSGGRFTAEGWLVPLGDEPFDVARRRAGAAAAFAATEFEDLGPATRVHALSTRVRDGLAVAVEPLGRPGQLLRGLTIGDTGGIDPATEESLRRSGLAHLLAVSGSNVAILLGAVALVLRRASFTSRIGACAAALTLFVVVVGPDASVLRAAGMGVVALAAVVYGRRTEPLHALGLALVAVIALRPGIVFSTGLHLSAAATAGLVLWTGPLARRFGRLPRPVSVAIAATIAAQAAVAPLLVGVFGQLPLAGVLASVLALPAVAPATVLGLAAAAAGAVVEMPARVLAHAASPFAGWILMVGERLGEPAWASVAVSPRWGIFLAAPVLAAAIAAIPGALGPRPRNLEADVPDLHPESR